MKYPNIKQARFLRRINRFVAICDLDGTETVVHVNNTGRCMEILVPDAKVYLSKSFSRTRSTEYDLVCVEKGERLINIDSQAPNRAAPELFSRIWPGCEIHPEQRYGDSRFDFLINTPECQRFVEVKGVTLEENDAVFFPDAPTIRGIKHLNGLCNAIMDGYHAAILFLIQMRDVSFFAPNERTHPEFAETLRHAANVGVEIIVWNCDVTPDSMTPHSPVPFFLHQR